MKWLFLFIVASAAHAQTLCTPELATLPTRSGGRVKPLIVLAEESLSYITGAAHYGADPATVTFCKLSFESLGVASGIDLPVKVEHVDAKKFLGLKDSDTSIAISKLEPELEKVRAEHGTLKENTAYKKELQKILNRAQVAQGITAGMSWTLPDVQGDTVEWLPLPQFVTEEKITALRTQTPEPFQKLFVDSKARYTTGINDDYLLEYKYHHLKPFKWSLALSLAALALAAGMKNSTPGLVLAFISLGVQVAGMVLRVMISGRAPITNMYETVMFSGFGALLLAVGLTIWKKERTFLWGGLAYNVLCLMMMRFANNMLDPSIGPLVPVLRDNFWLSTHVTTIILSYAALALSWVLANVVLGRQMFNRASDVRYQSEMIYTCLKFGVVTLAAGIILGGVWADYSWGRFWGWDPKETWSLIVLLVYMAILHGRSTAWIPPKRFIPLVAGAFMSVMMAWFGVNYILATGLHSYGFSEGGAIFLGSFFIIQTVFLGIAHLKLARGA
jgi:ABC-type transport system involved in cytochrome c biogenesis permease subunit